MDMGTNAENDFCPVTDAAPPHDDEQQRVVQLGIPDIPAISELEAACWSPEIRADEKTLQKRFELGHITLGLYMQDVLIGVTSFSYSRCGAPTLSSLPKTFHGVLDPTSS